MKKAKFAFRLLLFFLCGVSANFCFAIKVYAVSPPNKTISCYYFVCEFDGQVLNFSTRQFLSDITLSQHQQNLFKNHSNRIKLAETLLEMGFLKKDAISYALPEFEFVLKILKQKLNIEPQPNFVYVEKNKCKINITRGKDGRFLDLQNIFDQILKQKNTTQIKLKLKLQKQANKNNDEFVERGCFSTNFTASNESRKNNIKTALEMFDGLVLDVGEILRFNSVTGRRSKENGYSSAKIISGGTFVEGVGGGVCQVSTTLYNAALLSGLEILEVHNHSLPVGYVEPSFDAMVNIGSSDLVFRNNSGGKVVITTSSENDECKIKIFGKKNKYKITRVSEKIKTMPAENDRVETDLSKFPELQLELGEEKRISYAKDGFVSKGYLKFFNESGELVKTQHIRTDIYNPTKGIILKREN